MSEVNDVVVTVQETKKKVNGKKIGLILAGIGTVVLGGVALFNKFVKKQDEDEFDFDDSFDDEDLETREYVHIESVEETEE